MEWQCAGCGKEAEGNVKPCDCITGVGFRKIMTGEKKFKMEHTVFYDADNQTIHCGPLG